MTFHRLSVPSVRRKMREGEALSLTELALTDARSEVSAEEFADYRRDDSAAVDDGPIQSKVN